MFFWTGKTSNIIVFILLLFFTRTIFAKDVIASFRQAGRNFEDAYSGLRDELESEFELKDIVIDNKTAVNVMADSISLLQPRLVVLMDNASIKLFKTFQKDLKESDRVIPSVSIMGIYINDAIKDLRNAAGIAYEIPVVTSIVSLRSLLDVSIKKVGIIHRMFIESFIKQNKEFCKLEGIELSTVAVENKSDDYKPVLKQGLKKLLKEEDVDALWVPNDNALLQLDLLTNVWLPIVRKYNKPVVVGVEVLINPQLDFGTFAVLPDHISLGNQAAEMVYQIRDNNWKCENGKVEQPLAVYKVLNMTQVKNKYRIADDKLKSVDKQLK